MKLIIKIFFIYIALFPKLVYSQTLPSGFQTIFYEGFDYTAGQDLYYQSGGNGFTSNWKQSYLNKYLGIQSSGWTYPNLQTNGLRAAYDASCYGTCNDISSSGRDVPSQTTGVLYLQFLANFGSQLGGGTPHLRLYDASDLKLVIGGNTAANWQLVDVSSNTTVTTNKTLNAIRLVIIRLDYDNGGIKMWIDPTLNAFNYSAPPQPTAELPSNISAPSFNNLQIYLRSGGSPGIDEIHAFKSLPATTFGTFATITKQYFTGTHTISAPTTNNSNAIVYTSDNTAVATISGSVITFTGVGTANITATQAADANYEGNAVSTLLTVLGKDLVSKYGGISSTNVNYISANGSVGGALGLDKYGKQEYVSDGIISSGLVMHLDAGNAVSYPGTGTTWTDISGNGNNGTLVNGVTYNSANGGNLVFNGSNTYVNAPLTKTASCTFSVWAKSTNTNSNNMLFNAGNDGAGPDLFFSSGILSWNTWNSSGNPFGSIPASSSNGNWHNYVVVNEAVSNTAKLYYDGVLYGTAVYKNASVSTSLYIGGTTSTYMWNGAIGNFMVHNRALTSLEVLQNFNSTKSAFGV